MCYDPAMKLMLTALVATFAVAVTASVFAIWPVVADAPWEDEAESEREAAFNAGEIIKIAQAQVEDGDLPWPVDAYGGRARSVQCIEAKYLVDNGKRIVECQFRAFGTLPQDAPVFATRSYVFDDATGRLVD